MRCTLLCTAPVLVVTILMAGRPARGAEQVPARPVALEALHEWNIVVPDDATPSEQYAAEEFRSIFKQACAEELPIVRATMHAVRNIFIGAGSAMQASPQGFSTEGFGPEEFRIVVRDGNIVIAGGRPRGTLYGVYSFLEDCLGVRFLTADHTHVPRLEKNTRLDPIDRRYVPQFSFRWSYYGETNRDPAFAARLRCNTIPQDARYGGKTGQSLINHSFGHQLPASRYGKEHPEYFALVKGKRLGGEKDDWSQSQLCLTNPDVLRIVTESVLAELKAHPEKENISVSQNDNDKYCRCPNCAALDEREGTPMGSLLTFVNGVAEAVAREHPKVMVGTLSYWYTRKPPKTLMPRDNVQIQLCSIECCDIHPINDPNCPKNRAFCDDVDNWGRKTGNIFIWNYNTNFSNYLLPFPNLRVIEPNIRYFVAKKAKGVFMQAAGNDTGAELSDLRNYVMSGLLWDPTRQASKLEDEFLDLHYGKAAPPIRGFIKLTHDHAEASGLHQNCYGPASAFGIDDSIAKAGLQAFEEATKLADDDAVLARVEKASICAVRAAIEPAWLASGKNKLDPELAARMRPQVKRLFELCAKYKVPMFSEGLTIEAAKDRLRKIFDLKQGEEF